MSVGYVRSVRLCYVDKFASQHFSAVLHVKTVSTLTIHFCWRAAARALARHSVEMFLTNFALRARRGETRSIRSRSISLRRCPGLLGLELGCSLENLRLEV